MTAAVSWAARLVAAQLSGTRLAFLGDAWTRWGLSPLAAGELVTDQLPSTPSLKLPIQFGARSLTGDLSGLGFASQGGDPRIGAVGGVSGVVLGA